MNCRGGTHPHQPRQIQSLIAAFASEHGQTGVADDLTPFAVECLGVTRTFAEKLFAAYAAFEKDRALNYTRHYYDLYQLAGLAEVLAFIESTEFGPICADVHKHSAEHWPDKALPPGTTFAQYAAFRPSDAHLDELTRNYARESDLFFRPPPSLTEILARLQKLPFPQ